MTKNQHSRMHLPMLLGFVLLFLSDNFSDFSKSSFSKNQVYPVETVDFRPNSIEPSQIRYLYSASKTGVGRFKAWTYSATIFQKLSKNLSRLNRVRYKSQSNYFQSFANKITLTLLYHIALSHPTEDSAFLNS